MPMTPVGPIYSPADARLALYNIAQQSRLLSSPFIRWLLENQRMLGTEGVLSQALPILREALVTTPGGAALPPMSQALFGSPGVSFEQASPQQFRDLVNRYQSIVAGSRRLLPTMLPPGIREQVFPESQRLIPPGATMPGRPF